MIRIYNIVCNKYVPFPSLKIPMKQCYDILTSVEPQQAYLKYAQIVDPAHAQLFQEWLQQNPNASLTL